MRLKVTEFSFTSLFALPVLAIEGLPYQKEPFENLVVSGQPSEEQLNTLAEEGFTTVINLRRPGEFDEFDEAEVVAGLGMNYVHIPVRNVEAITPEDAKKLDEALSNAPGQVLLHCTVGWRAGSMLAISRYLFHDASEKETIKIATDAHMSHATGDVKDWLKENGR